MIFKIYPACNHQSIVFIIQHRYFQVAWFLKGTRLIRSNLQCELPAESIASFKEYQLEYILLGTLNRPSVNESCTFSSIYMKTFGTLPDCTLLGQLFMLDSQLIIWHVNRKPFVFLVFKGSIIVESWPKKRLNQFSFENGFWSCFMPWDMCQVKKNRSSIFFVLIVVKVCFVYEIES